MMSHDCATSGSSGDEADPPRSCEQKLRMQYAGRQNRQPAASGGAAPSAAEPTSERPGHEGPTFDTEPSLPPTPATFQIAFVHCSEPDVLSAASKVQLRRMTRHLTPHSSHQWLSSERSWSHHLTRASRRLRHQSQSAKVRLAKVNSKVRSPLPARSSSLCIRSCRVCRSEAHVLYVIRCYDGHLCAVSTGSRAQDRWPPPAAAAR